MKEVEVALARLTATARALDVGTLSEWEELRNAAAHRGWQAFLSGGGVGLVAAIAFALAVAESAAAIAFSMAAAAGAAAALVAFRAFDRKLDRERQLLKNSESLALAKHSKALSEARTTAQLSASMQAPDWETVKEVLAAHVTESQSAVERQREVLEIVAQAADLSVQAISRQDTKPDPDPKPSSA